MRAFVALELPGPVRQACGALLDELRRPAGRLRLAVPENLHVTLAFLGEIPEALAPELGAALAEGLAGTLTFPLAVRGVGAFPHWRAPRVLWFGVDDPLGACATVHERVWAVLDAYDFPRERRPFRAHVTFGRVRSGRIGREFRDALRAAEGFAAPVVPAERVVLMESRLHPDGARYSALAEARLSTIPA